MARRGSPGAQLPLGDVEMSAYFPEGEEPSRKEFMPASAVDQANQAFCESLTDYNWQSTDLEGLLREEVIYSTESDRHAPQLDEAMADTSLDILTDSPGAVQANEAAAQEPDSLQMPQFSQPPSLPGTPSAAAAAARVSPAPSPVAVPAVPAVQVPVDSRDTSSQESNEPLLADGAGGRLSRQSRSAMSSRQSLAAEAGDQADTPRRARTKAQALLDMQHEHMEQERYQLQAQAAELQAKQMQLHRDYMALQLGPPNVQIMYPGQPGKEHQLGPGSSAADVLRSGSASGSGASGLSRNSNYSSQFQFSYHPLAPTGQPLLQQPPPHGSLYGQLSGGPFMGMSQQQQAPQSGSVPASPTLSSMEQQRQTQSVSQPGFVPSQPLGPYGDPLMMVGWQPRPPSFYAPTGGMAPFRGASPTVLAAPKPVEQPPSSEACMLGELKQLIDQLDQQTKATMKDSLYRISRHAQGASPKVQQAAVAQGAGPAADSGATDDISPVDRMVADLLYKGHAAQQMPAFAASLAMQPMQGMRRQMPATMHMVPQRPAASDQGSAALVARHQRGGGPLVPGGAAAVTTPGD